MEISICSHPNNNIVIATIFGTWHDSWAVVACAKFCCDMITSNWITAKWNFHRIWIVMEKSLVKWVPNPHVSHFVVFCCVLLWFGTHILQDYFISTEEILTHWPLGDFLEIFRYAIFTLMSTIYGWGIFLEIAHRCLSQDFTDDKSILVQVMAWCHQATSHYLSQCCPRSLSPYGVTRPQWVNSLSSSDMHLYTKQHWFRQWLVAWPAPSHYLNQCCDIVNLTLRNKLQWNFNWN